MVTHNFIHGQHTICGAGLPIARSQTPNVHAVAMKYVQLKMFGLCSQEDAYLSVYEKELCSQHSSSKLECSSNIIVVKRVITE